MLPLHDGEVEGISIPRGTDHDMRHLLRQVDAGRSIFSPRSSAQLLRSVSSSELNSDGTTTSTTTTRSPRVRRPRTVIPRPGIRNTLFGCVAAFISRSMVPPSTRGISKRVPSEASARPMDTMWMRSASWRSNLESGSNCDFYEQVTGRPCPPSRLAPAAQTQPGPAGDTGGESRYSASHPLIQTRNRRN